MSKTTFYTVDASEIWRENPVEVGRLYKVLYGLIIVYVIQLAGANCDFRSHEQPGFRHVFFLRIDEQMSNWLGGGSHQKDNLSYMGGSLNGGTLKTPQNDHF